MLATIQLPAGTDRVTVRDISDLIADALHPAIPEDTPRQITRLMKMPTTAENAANWCGAGCQPFPVSLTDEDMAGLITGVWAKLPPLVLPISEPDWMPYAEAVQANPPTGWQLVVWNSGSPHLNAAMERHIAEGEWKEAVKKAALHGQLTPRHPTTLLPQPQPVGDWLLDCFVTIDDLTQFLTRFDIGVGFAKKASAPTSQREASEATSDWRVKAREIADECYDRDTASKCRDSLIGYSRRVMDEMQSRNIHGPRGLIDNPRTIQREALQGKKWWANKTK